MSFETRQKKNLEKNLSALQKQFSSWDASSDLEEKALIEGLALAEKTSLSLRNLCSLYQIDPMEISQRELSIGVKISSEGWLELTLPVLLPKKNHPNGLRFLAEPIYNALLSVKNHPMFPIHFSHICFMHFYHDAPVRDHDNLEVKKVLDLISECCLVDDDGLHCSLTHFSFQGEKNETIVYIMPEKNYKNWLEKTL